MELSLTETNARLAALGSSAWAYLRRVLAAISRRSTVRQLRVCESVSLGEKRVVAVVEYQGRRFLVGGGAASVNLLAPLGDTQDFAELLTDWCERQR